MNQLNFENQQIVHDAAAFLFWTLAEAVGVSRANDAVINSSGYCLLDMPFTEKILGRYGFQDVSSSNQRQIAAAIAAEANDFAVRGENMDGLIYAEDASNGRSPSAQGIQVAGLAVLPKRVNISGGGIMKIGRLCLRHPLPAVVFSNADPQASILEVADTSLALGFHLPMFLTRVSTTKIGINRFVSTGIFYIPVPDSHAGDKWNAAIQNSIRTFGNIDFYGPRGKAVVNVEW